MRRYRRLQRNYETRVALNTTGLAGLAPGLELGLFLDMVTRVADDANLLRVQSTDTVVGVVSFIP